MEVRTGARVAEVLEDGVEDFSDGEFIPSELVVWSAGVKAPDFLSNIAGLETNRINQLAVRPTLQTTLDDSIFAIGDCAACLPPRLSSGCPSAGVKAPDFLSRYSRAGTNRINQLAVLPTLQTTRDDNIFAIGDCAACLPPRLPSDCASASAGRASAGRIYGEAAPPMAGPATFADTLLLATSVRWYRLADYSTIGSLWDPDRPQFLRRRLFCAADVPRL